MSINLILEDWSDYDNRKLKTGDRAYFSCEESWEVDFLTRKIKRLNPLISEIEIRNAIMECCKTVKAPRPRNTFVKCVAQRLKIPT